MTGAYYNEIDPFAAEWLRTLILFDHVAPGDVDTRSILDVCPDDLKGYTQCHFFAGIGVWSYALRQAGWADERPIWTGSCPCQPFSQAGKGGGFDDERHLWPAWHWLIDQSRPDVVFGEQVASKDGLAWFDLVQADMEGTDYAGGAVDLCVAGVGGPHIRQRLFYLWLSDAARRGQPVFGNAAFARGGRHADGGKQFGGLSHGQGDGRPGRPDDSDQGRRERASGPNGETCRSAKPPSGGQERFRYQPACGLLMQDEPTRGFWSGADWLWYRDGKYRPVEAGTFPLAPSAPGRVGRLRGYGNAINAEVAHIFIEEALKVMP